MSKNRDSSVYAAAQGREFVRNELKGKSNQYIREFAGLIDDRETLDLLNYFCSLWADEDESFLETRLGSEIIQSAATHTADRAFRDGNSSILQGMVGLTDQSEDGHEFITRAARKFMHEGMIGLILGAPGTGKTALTLDIARVWAAITGGYLIGNTDWDGFDAVVTSDREMFVYMANHDGPVLAVIDETAQDLSGFGSGNKDAEAFSDALTFLRKSSDRDFGPHPKKGRLLMVNHTRKKTAAALRRLCSIAIEKPSREDPGRARILETEGGKDEFSEGSTVTGITDTRESYPEHEPSEFTIELADDGQEDDGQEDDGRDDGRQEQIRAAIMAYKPWDPDGGMSYREISKEGRQIVTYGRNWVGNRVSDWEDGQYRDLVEDPTDGEWTENE